MALLGTLRDNFDDNAVDTSKWPASFGTFTETGGRARVTCDTGFNAYASAAAYTLADSYGFCQIFPPAAGGAATEAFGQLLIRTTTMGTDAIITVNAATGTIDFASRVGFVDPDSLSITYDPVQHAYVKIREDTGTLFWETSPDGVDWTIQRADTSPAWVTDLDLQAVLIAHRDSGTTDFAEFDNFNIDTGPLLRIDWNNDGDFLDPFDDVTDDVLKSGGVVSSYGRDQSRQLSPSQVGRAAFSLCNGDRIYSPENTSSPLFGDLLPARHVRFDVVFAGDTYPIHRGRIDDFTVKADYQQRQVDFTALDGLGEIQGVEISTEVLFGYRTGQIIHAILDEVGWPADRRDIDAGATFPRHWWAEDEDAFTAIQDIVLSEGPPAIAYIAPDGTFTFRDRHHRLLRDVSLVSQATFSAPAFACDALDPAGFDYLPPFEYQHGWRDIINSVDIETPERAADVSPSVVWSHGTSISISSGQTIEVEASASDPFFDAIVPEAGTDFTVAGGSVTASLTRTSGQSTVVRLMAVGNVVVTGLQLRATALPAVSTTKITQEDTVSIGDNGIRTYPLQVPWANENDALAVAQLVIAHYAARRPIVKLRIVSQDDAHYLQVLTRTISDRITIVNDEMGLSDDFLIEQVSHTVVRIDPDRAPIHYVVLGCERRLINPADPPFTFDVVGRGFDDGEFGSTGIDDPGTIFIFDHPTQGQFDTGVFAT